MFQSLCVKYNRCPD